MATTKVAEKKKKDEKIWIPGISRGRIHSMGRFVSKWEKDSLCNKAHPLQVKVGKHEVFCIGSRDFEIDKHLKIIQDLDVFFGLGWGWSQYEEKVQPEFRNPLLQCLHKKLVKDDGVIDNIIVAEIPDRGINEHIANVIAETLREGKKIGFGCMAGHGRTGWVLAKLIKRFEHVNGDEAVKRVRERYCPKCVESAVQIKNLGCKEIKGSDSTSKSAVEAWEYDVEAGKWKPTTSSQLGISSASPVFDSYDWGDGYYKKMSSREEWFKDLDIPKQTDGVVEDEENRDQEVDAVVKQNLADAGYVDPADDDDDEDETVEVIWDDERIEALSTAWEKWMTHQPLTAEEQALIDTDLGRARKSK